MVAALFGLSLFFFLAGAIFAITLLPPLLFAIVKEGKCLVLLLTWIIRLTNQLHRRLVVDVDQLRHLHLRHLYVVPLLTAVLDKQSHILRCQRGEDLPEECPFNLACGVPFLRHI